MKEGCKMKAKVDSNCVGCGFCPAVCPEVFEMGDDGVAKVIVEVIAVENENGAVEAAEGCPVAAIIIQK
jgi:ferredoxin